MGFVPIFLALALFIMLWGIVVGQFIRSERRKITTASAELGIPIVLDQLMQGEGSEAVLSVRAKMIRYNRLISSFPYKIIASLMNAKGF